MANEIANIAQAGIALQVFEDPFDDGTPTPPIIMGSWGVVEASLVAVSTDGGGANTGEYQIRLLRPGSGVAAHISGESPSLVNGYTSLDHLLQWSGYISDEDEIVDFEPNPWVCRLLPDPDGPAPVEGKRIDLPILSMAIWADGQDSEQGLINCQVIQIPHG